MASPAPSQPLASADLRAGPSADNKDCAPPAEKSSCESTPKRKATPSATQTQVSAKKRTFGFERTQLTLETQQRKDSNTKKGSLHITISHRDTGETYSSLAMAKSYAAKDGVSSEMVGKYTITHPCFW